MGLEPISKSSLSTAHIFCQHLNIFKSPPCRRREKKFILSILTVFSQLQQNLVLTSLTSPSSLFYWIFFLYLPFKYTLALYPNSSFHSKNARYLAQFMMHINFSIYHRWLNERVKECISLPPQILFSFSFALPQDQIWSSHLKTIVSQNSSSSNTLIFNPNQVHIYLLY